MFSDFCADFFVRVRSVQVCSRNKPNNTGLWTVFHLWTHKHAHILFFLWLPIIWSTWLAPSGSSCLVFLLLDLLLLLQSYFRFHEHIIAYGFMWRYADFMLCCWCCTSKLSASDVNDNSLPVIGNEREGNNHKHHLRIRIFTAAGAPGPESSGRWITWT